MHFSDKMILHINSNIFSYFSTIYIFKKNHYYKTHFSQKKVVSNIAYNSIQHTHGTFDRTFALISSRKLPE